MKNLKLNRTVKQKLNHFLWISQKEKDLKTLRRVQMTPELLFIGLHSNLYLTIKLFLQPHYKKSLCKICKIRACEVLEFHGNQYCSETITGGKGNADIVSEDRNRVMVKSRGVSVMQWDCIEG